MGSTSKANTPLAQVLRHLGITQDTLAVRLGVDQGRVSKLVRRVPRPETASAILEALPGARDLVSELHLLYPDRYPDWKPPSPAAPPAAGST